MRDEHLSAAAIFQPLLSTEAQLVTDKTEGAAITARDTEPLKRDLAIGKSALVVDDVSDVTEMLAVLLTHAGYKVVTASSARMALTAVQETQFDVIISDIGMPEMNGYQLAREIRKLPGYEAVPMLAVTGYSMFDDKERSLNAGFNAHLTKPIDTRALLKLIEQL